MPDCKEIVFCIKKMAKQAGPFFITGTIDSICFYRMDGCYYARAKSSLAGKRVKKDPAFRETMRYAELMKKASVTASMVYRALPEKQKVKGLFRKLVGRVIRLLKENKTTEEILVLLQPKKTARTLIFNKENRVEEISFGEEILRGLLGEVVNEAEEFYCLTAVPP